MSIQRASIRPGSSATAPFDMVIRRRGGLACCLSAKFIAASSLRGIGITLAGPLFSCGDVDDTDEAHFVAVGFFDLLVLCSTLAASKSVCLRDAATQNIQPMMMKALVRQAFWEAAANDWSVMLVIMIVSVFVLLFMCPHAAAHTQS